MKKLIYCALALAAGLFAASCQQENLEPVAQENTVTYTVELPGVQTKAFMGTVSKVDELIYEVWKTEAADERDLNGTSDNGNAKATLLYQKTVPMTNQRTVITLNLVQDQEYTVLFWAQKRGTGVYNTDALTDVYYAKTWNGSEDDANCLYSNQESYEAYYATEFISDGDKKSRTVVLKRPFAQLNLGTKNTQMEDTGKEFGEGEYNVEVVSSKVTVSNVGTHFNVANNYVATPDREASIAVTGASSVTFETATDPSNIEGDASSQFEYITVNGQKYEYVAMNYLFATGSNVTVSYEINTVLSDKNNTLTTEAKVTNTVYEVPLQENYRTNIVGNLLTSTSDYEVIVDPSWAGDDLAPDPLYLAASLGGEITLEQDYEFTAPFVVTKDLKINLNGHTIKGGKDYVSGAGLTAADISAITIDKNATLTIEGEGNIQGGEYALVSSADLANMWEPAGEWSSETILDINFFSQGAYRSWGSPLAAGGTVLPTLMGMNSMSGSAKYGNEGWGFFPLTASAPKAFEEGDLRKAVTVYEPAKEAGVTYTARYQDTGFYNAKYLPRLDGNAGQIADAVLNYGTNIRLYRYAETLLNAAELGVLTGKDRSQYLAEVRARANCSATGTSQLDILEERHKEFVGEGKRYWDLIRTDQAAAVLTAANHEWRQIDWTPNKKYWPLPQSECDKDPNLVQNNY